MSDTVSNIRPAPDKLIVDLAEYAANYVVDSREAIDTARYNLMDTLGCGLLALRYPECVKHFGPVVPGATLSTARACRAPRGSSIRCRRRSTSAR